MKFSYHTCIFTCCDCHRNHTVVWRRMSNGKTIVIQDGPEPLMCLTCNLSLFVKPGSTNVKDGSVGILFTWDERRLR